MLLQMQVVPISLTIVSSSQTLQLQYLFASSFKFAHILNTILRVGHVSIVHDEFAEALELCARVFFVRWCNNTVTAIIHAHVRVAVAAHTGRTQKAAVACNDRVRLAKHNTAHKNEQALAATVVIAFGGPTNESQPKINQSIKKRQ